MTQLAEVELQNELDTLRHCASGLTFAEAPDVFKVKVSNRQRVLALQGGAE